MGLDKKLEDMEDDFETDAELAEEEDDFDSEEEYEDNDEGLGPDADEEDLEDEYEEDDDDFDEDEEDDAENEDEDDDEFDLGITKERVAEATSDFNDIYKEGTAVAKELKEAYDDIMSAFDFGGIFKKK